MQCHGGLGRRLFPGDLSGRFGDRLWISPLLAFTRLCMINFEQDGTSCLDSEESSHERPAFVATTIAIAILFKLKLFSDLVKGSDFNVFGGVSMFCDT